MDSILNTSSSNNKVDEIEWLKGTEEELVTIVTDSSYALLEIKEPTEEICMAAIHEDESALQLINIFE